MATYGSFLYGAALYGMSSDAAAGTGSAFNATVSTAAGGTGVASGTGQAFNATVVVSGGATGVATGTGAAHNASVAIATGGLVPAYLANDGVLGSYLSTPDAAAWALTAELTIIAKLAPDDWNTAGVISGQFDSGTTQRSWWWLLDGAGTISFQWSPNGTTVNNSTYDIVGDLAPPNGQPLWIKVNVDLDPGAEIDWYTSTDTTNDPTAVTWTLQEADATGTSSFFASTADVHIGQVVAPTTPHSMAGKLYAIRHEILGVAISDLRFAAGTTSTFTEPTMTDAQGIVWTEHGGADVIFETSVESIAEGTGAAFNSSSIVAPAAGAATGTGAAFTTGTSIATGADVASGTGQAFDAIATDESIANAGGGHAAGVGEAFNATVARSARLDAADLVLDAQPLAETVAATVVTIDRAGLVLQAGGVFGLPAGVRVLEPAQIILTGLELGHTVEATTVALDRGELVLDARRLFHPSVRRLDAAELVLRGTRMSAWLPPTRIGTLVCAPWSDDLNAACRTASTDDALVQQMLQSATEIVWALSGRRFGTCNLEVRPCRRRCLNALPTGWSFWGAEDPIPTQAPLERILWLQCQCEGDNCECSPSDRIRLRAPVQEVFEVWDNGTLLDPAAYRVDDYRWLVRVDGRRWPDCSNFDAPANGEGSFVVRFGYGPPPPVAGVLAVEEFACELLKAYEGRTCALPQRVTSIARQGVSFAMLDPMDFLDSGKTGIYGVDVFLASVNPKRLQSRGRVFRADAPPGSRRVGT